MEVQWLMKHTTQEVWKNKFVSNNYYTSLFKKYTNYNNHLFHNYKKYDDVDGNAEYPYFFSSSSYLTFFEMAMLNFMFTDMSFLDSLISVLAWFRQLRKPAHIIYNSVYNNNKFCSCFASCRAVL